MRHTIVGDAISQALNQQARLLEAQGEQFKQVATAVSHIDDFCQRVGQTLATATAGQQRELVELLIDRVVVTDSEVEIRYIIPISSRGEQIRFWHLHTDYLQGQPGDVDPPDERHIGRRRSPPPEPHWFRGTGLFGKALDFDQD